MKKYAFTLAEVLITLGIIGIVAAITMPVLITNYQKQVTVERLKKSFSVISNAFVSSQYENGDMNTWGMDNLGSVDDNYENIISSFLKNYIIKYLDISVDCGLNCNLQTNIKRNRLNGKDWVWNSRFLYVVYLKDGTIVSFMIDNSGYVYQLVRIYVDINGNQKPNLSGKDIFTFKLAVNANNAINMSGITEAKMMNNRDILLKDCRECCSKNSGDYAGDYCSGLIQYDGWKISKDYPW